MINIFSEFTDRARRVSFLAREEAQDLHHPTVGPEHFLLAMAAEGENGKGGVAHHALTKVGFDLKRARDYCFTKNDIVITDNPFSIPFTSSAKKLLEQSLREATSLGNDFIGTEHLLLGLVTAERLEESLAGEILRDQRIGLGVLYETVTNILADMPAYSTAHSTNKLMDEIATLKSEVGSLRIDLLRARKKALEAEIRGLTIALQTIEAIMAKED